MVVSSPIPQDLVEEIIGHLHDDVEALTCCSAVAHAFHLPSRKLLFSNVYFNTHISVIRFRSLLKNAPSIATSIRTLHLGYFLAVEDCGSLLLFISRHVQHIKHLIIEGPKGRSWEQLSEKHITALEILVSSPNLQSLKLSHIFLIPVRFLLRAKGIRTLSMEFVVFKDDTTMIYTTTFAQLETLRLGYSVQINQATLFMMPKLRQLHIHGRHQPSLRCALDFINNTSNKIEDFVWCNFTHDNFGVSSRSIIPPYHEHQFSEFMNPTFGIPLGIRRLCFAASNNKVFNTNVLSAILGELGNTPMTQGIETLTLAFTLPVSMWSILTLNELDDLLSDTSRFSRLMNVEFIIDPEILGRPGVRETFLSYIWERLPKLCEAGIVKVNLREGLDWVVSCQLDM
ncbi:hypothetical protein BDZ94DRAFT_1312219 [Collybia nuda]|uniref:Uncharacterized protein n=1 Tax=Collybia nuda TaxID=64659 RepID=A0A9P5XZI6_9AGAR|nr:hypothetical protein BDZ94DRAFT_1312219 [Collybia nuda]